MSDKNSVFQVEQNSLEVFQTIVANNEEISHIRVISHNVCINWRQVNSSERDKADKMNFHFEADVGINDAIEAINKICEGKNGVLLESGRFFHYYGNFLLYHKKWLHFLGQFLMPCVLVSPRYIGHALNDDYCSLRLTADNIFKPKIPTVVHIFN